MILAKETVKRVEMNEAQFKLQLQEQGYGEAQSVDFEPNSVLDDHTHDFSAFVLVQSGEITLVTADGPVTYRPGETCMLAADTLHSEHIGATGATLLIGRK